MCGNELTQERNLSLANRSTSIAILNCLSSSVTEIRFERKGFYNDKLTRRHIGAACVSGLPADNNKRA
jgi:hypothetical protein